MALTANQDWLYKQMTGMNVDLGSEEQFAQAMQDESNRQWVYEQAGKMGIDLGTPEQFASAMQMPNAEGMKPKIQPDPLNDERSRAFGQMQDPLYSGQYQYHQQVADKEAQMQREEQAQLPITDHDRQLQEQIRQMEIEGKWGKPNGTTFGVDKQTGMPTITKTEGDGMHLYAGEQLANQDEIDALKGQLPSYLTREVKTPEDLLVNTAEAWSSNTEMGRDFKDMLEAGTISPEEYKQAMIETNQDYINQQTRILGQKATNATIADISKTINPIIEQMQAERREAMQRAAGQGQMRGGAYGAISAQMSANMAYDSKKDAVLSEYLQAQQYLVDAIKISEAAQKGQGFWKGLGGSLGDVDTWDMGISQLVRSANLKKIVEKYEKKPDSLTDSEKALMDAAVAYMSACAYNSDKLSRLYKAGQTTGESLPFMLQFAVMPIGAIKNKVAKGILGYGIEQFGGKALQTAGKYTFGRAAAETGTALLGNIAAAGVQTAAFGAPKIAEGTISRMTGDIKPEFDENGRIIYGGRENQQGLGEALWNAGVDTYVENLSEMILTSGDPIKAWVGGTNLFKNLSKNETIQVLAKMGDKWSGSTMGKIAGQMQFRNYPEEVAEEYVGNLLRWGMSTDVHSAAEAGLDADSQIDLWMGLAPTSIAFAGLGLGEYSVRGGIDRFQSSQAARKLRNIMLEGEERKYLDNLLKSRDSDEFKFAAHDVVKSILRNDKLSVQEKRAYLDNLYVTYQSQLALEAEDAKIADEVKTEVQGITNKNNGYVYPVSLAGDPDTQGHIVAGYVEVDETDPSKPRIGNDEIVTVKLNDGRVVQLNTKELDLTGTPQMAQEVFNARAEERINTQRVIDQSKNIFHQGDVATIQVPNEQTGETDEFASNIVSVSDEGVEVEVIDPTGQVSTTIIPHDVALQTLTVANKQPIQAAETPSAQQQTTGVQQAQPQVQTANMPVFVNGDESISVVDNRDGTYTNPATGEIVTREQMADKGYAFINPQPTSVSQAPVEAPVVQQAPVEQAPDVQQPEVQEPAAPVVPNIETMSAADYAGAAVEYMGSREYVDEYLDGEIKKVQQQLDVANRKKVGNVTDMADFKAKKDAIEAEKKALQARLDKLTEAREKAKSYLTIAEREQRAQAEAERRAAEEAARIAREQAAAAEAARLEQERIDRELKKGVPDFSEDNDRDARNRGFHVVNGQVIHRQEPLQPLATGKAVTVQFAKGQNGAAEAHHVLIPVSMAQPSHINGQRNPAFFISEAQPKDRRDQVSKVTSDMMAQNIHPDEIVEGATAYVGAPVLNVRGEAVQGNNRLDALIKMYQSHPESVAKYKQYLIDNAAALGYTETDIETIRNNDVIDVRMLDNVTDEQAIQLGQKKATDLETGGVQLIDPQVTANQLGDRIQRFSEILLKSNDDEATLADLTLRNGRPALEFLQKLGIISDAQMQSAFDSRGNLTAEAKAALQGVLKQVLFQNAESDNLPIMFDDIPITAQKAILQTIVRDLQSPEESRLVPDIQEAIGALYRALHQSAEVKNGRNEQEIRAAMRSWALQMQFPSDFDAENFVPSEIFSNFALELATLFKYGKQTEIAKKLNAYYDAVQGTTGGLFGDTPAIPYKEAIKQIFGIDYKSVDEVLREKHRKELTDYLNTIADEGHPFELYGNDNVIEILKGLGANDVILARAQELIDSGESILGIKGNGGRLLLNSDSLADKEAARSKYVHERQHLLTTPEQKERVLKAASVDELKLIVKIFTNGSDFYDRAGEDEIADEFISYSMEEAYAVESDEELESILRAAGANDELINIIKSINNEQRENDERLGQSERLGNARRHTDVDTNSEGHREQGGRDQGTESGVLEPKGARLDTRGELGGRTGGENQGSTEGAGLSEVGTKEASGEAAGESGTPKPNANSDQEGAGVGQERGLGEVTQSPTEEEQQQAVQYLNEALQEVISKSGDKLPQNITIDENTIEDNPDSVEMTARLLIDGKPSDFSVTIFDQSLGARGGFDPVNMVKFYPREELDKWDWDLADRLAEEFNKTRTQESGFATVMDESDAVYFFNMQAALDFAEKARQEIAPSDDPRFSISGTQVIPVGEKTLVGLHNISAEKLRKVMKAGGLANPSAAVIDIAKQDHHDYGEVSLVLPSSLIERADGTYPGDAWTPMYPPVEYRAGKDTEKRIKALTKGLPDNLASAIALRIRDYMDGNSRNSGMEYLYLKEQGRELPIEHTPRRYPYISIKQIADRLGIAEPEYWSSDVYQAYEQLPEDQLFDFNLWLEQNGNQEEIDKRKAMVERWRSEGKDAFANTWVGRQSQRMSFAAFDSAGYRILRDERDAGEENTGMTLDKASYIVDTEGLRPEFETWLQQKIDGLGYEEVLFGGYTPSGNRRWLPNTVENASKLMNQKSQTNYLERESVNETKAMLMEKFRTLAQIRKHRDILEPDREKIKAAYEAVSSDWNQLGMDFRDYTQTDKRAYQLDDNPFIAIDTALARIQEAMFKADPIAFLNREYRYSLPADSEFGTRIKEIKERIKNLPSRYFETKFRRPVYLNEFANAVVPVGLPQDLRDGLTGAGMTLFEYDPAEQGSRRAATLKATADEGIRFAISGRSASTGSSKRSNRDIEALRQFESVRPEIAEEMESIKNNALNDGTFMQAPNGKPTNLDERQWLQVRLRSFKRWFGDWENDPQNASKIIDWNGEPLVMYHGRSPIANFTEFMLSPFGRYGEGVYFTSNRLSAENYSRRYGADKGAENVVSAFLNIRNPYNSQVWWASAIKDDLTQYDGLISPNGLYFEENETIVKDPNQIKSATHNDGSFSEENDDIRFSISNQNNDIFYSNAERAVEGIKQEKATPEQWRAMIEKAGGLKAGEDKWIGLSDWLAQQRPTVTPQANETRSQFVVRLGEESKRFTISKQDILDYIREHKIQIEEQEYGEYEEDALFLERKDEFKRYYDEAVEAGEEEPNEVAWDRMIEEYGDDFSLGYYAVGDELMRDNDSDYAQWEADSEGRPRNINETRLRYTTWGLENKREIALIVPDIEEWNENDEIHFGDAGPGKAIAWVRFGDTHKIKEDWTDGEGNLHKGVEALADVLVIDEIQSKRHQEGREKGYKASPTEEETKEIIRREKVANSLRGDKYDFEREMKVKYGLFDFEDIFKSQMTDAERDEWRQYDHDVDEAEAELHELKDRFPYDPSTPPVAPFEKNWHELAMKRILRFAAENGYDKVAWTTGEQQAKRYDIGKEIDHIVKTDENTYEVYPTSGLMMTLEFDENGMYADEYDREYNGKSMSDIFGKDLAKRLKEMPVDETLQGDGLRVGYDGMKGFYDEILPRFMQKYGKKWGVQVGEVTMPQLEDGYQTMHAIDITDAMRESVLEGQPMFSISGRGVNGTMKPQEGETRSQYIARVAETVKNMTPRNTTIDDVIRFSITVNHNSPYLLKRADGAFVDPETGERLGFDHRFMGKGEGGQAHGWGSYFSVNDLRNYGEGYGFSLRDIRDAFNTSRWQSFGVGDAFDIAKGYLLEAHSEKAPSLRKWLEDRLAQKQELLKSYEGKVANTAEEDLMVFRAEADVQYIPALLRDMVNDIDTRNRHHYTVEIPDNDGTNYFEEDQPLTREQIDRLRKAAKETGIPKFLETISGFLRFAETNPEEYPFRKFYSDITDFQYGYPRETISNFLKDAGFVGIHYDGHRDGECYVIFDENDAVITDHIRFSVTGSRGAANIDKMEGVTTRMDNLAAARQMEEDGKDAKTIRMATGWERGADGKWRYEIDDVQLNTDNVKANFRKLDRRGVTAPMVWYHNKFTDIIADSPERKQLLAAYPQLADLDIEFYDYPNKERGAYSSEKKKISVNRANVRSVDECRSVLLHEIQHAIQEAELFAKGTSKEQIQLTWKLNNEVHNKVDEYFDKMGFKEWLTSHNGDKAFVDRLIQVTHMFPNRDFNIHYLFVETLPRDKQIDAIDVLGDANDVIQSNRDAIYGADRKGMTMKPDELYHNAAGEVESRNVQNRMNLTPEERRERLLAETEDVAREDQVVIMNAFDVANDSNEDDRIRFAVSGNYQSRNSIVTEALVKQANDSFRLMQSALRKVSADLRTINAIRTQQFEYDRKVVDMLLDLYNSLLQENSVWAGYMPDTTRRIATQIVHAIGKKDISAEVNTIMDHMVHAQAKAAQRQWDKLRTTPVDKINISGVVMQGKVALQGQHALKAMNEALDSKATIEQLEDQIAQLMDMEDNATDESLKLQYKGQWIGYTIAAQHLERIQHLVDERNQLDIELQAARSNRAIKQSARQQLVANIQQAMRDNYIAQADAYAQSAKDLAEYVTTQEEQAKDFIHRQDANRDKIRSYAQRDLDGLATNPNRNRTRGNIVRQIWDAFASPIRDLQSLLRLTGLHAPDGEGYLYNHFMRGWMDGADKERLGIVNASKTLDAKISELTHGKYKTWEEAARKINDASHNMFTITMLNGVDGKDMPVTEDIPLSAGNALYIYAVNKMNDGRMKLAGMNITEDDVKALTDKVREQFGQEILDVVDWVQSEYFSQLRNRYNPTHEALFGAPMDAIENYFPLRINAAARQQNEDLSEPDTDAARLLAGTSTGAIKRRTRNSLPLDVRNADFFQEVIRHISQMERWNAFAQWNRDANILFSDINFRNRIKGMKGTIYGEGDKLYNYMKDAFRVAIGTYKPNADGFSKEILNAAKGVTSAKINFRVFTALKQIASFPAFFTYMQDGTFVTSYLRNWLTPHSTMKWAKENLPNFEKRVSKRDLGDMRLMSRSTDWQWNKRILEWSSKYGMFFNVFFDTLTCATGARAVYDSHLADYMKKGYSEEEARNRARQDAEQAFNTSQQSSEGAFMAPIQMDRNAVTAALTVFRTSPMQYTRNFFYHTRNLLRKFGEGKREEQIAFRMGQYKNDGLNEEQARKAAEKDYNKSIRADVTGVVVYGALLGILWRLVGSFPYLFFGDDDDKKKQIVMDAVTGGAFVQPITGLIGGSYIESALDGNGLISSMFAPELPFTQDAKRAEQYLQNNKYAEFASQALSVLMQSGTGFDPLTASDMVSRIVTTLDSEEELDAATQALRVSQALLSIPQSQYEQMLIDKVVSGETDEDAALEDYIRYQKIHTAPLTWWLRGEESDEKAEENAEKRFNKLLTERDKIKNPEDYEE